MEDRALLDVYWVALFKDMPLYFVAGPFLDYGKAERHLEDLPEISVRCRYVVVKSKVEVEICEGQHG